jgi:hypothetical protein
MTTVMVDGERVQYDGLPSGNRETVRRYIEHGYEPGSGTRAILENRLMAVLMCDDETVAAMPQIVRWLHNHAPSECHGSQERVDRWMRERRAARERNARVAEPLRGIVNSIGGERE